MNTLTFTFYVILNYLWKFHRDKSQGSSCEINLQANSSKYVGMYVFTI